MCSENMEQIVKSTPMWKCNFNKAAKQLYWSHTSAWVSSCTVCSFSTPKLLYRINNRIWLKGLVCKASSVAFRQSRWYNKIILTKGYSVPRDFSWTENYKLFKFFAYLQNTFSQKHLWMAASETNNPNEINLDYTA